MNLRTVSKLKGFDQNKNYNSSAINIDELKWKSECKYSECKSRECKYSECKCRLTNICMRVERELSLFSKKMFYFISNIRSTVRWISGRACTFTHTTVCSTLTERFRCSAYLSSKTCKICSLLEIAKYFSITPTLCNLMKRQYVIFL